MGSIAFLFGMAMHASVGSSFTIGKLTYTVLTEDPDTSTGTVSVKAAGTDISGAVVIPETVSNGRGLSAPVRKSPPSLFPAL